MSDSTYVRAMAGLRQVNERAGLDSAARETARDSVLRANKTTRDQMERMAAFLAKDSERAAAVFHAIEKRAPAATP